MAKKRAKRGLAAAAADRPITVVYIHGIGPKPAPDVLKRQWDQALFGADMGARTRMAYWADIRHPVADVKGLAVGTPEAYRPLTDVELGDESRRLAPYGKDAHAFARALAKRLLQGTTTGPKAKGLEAKVLPGFIRKPVTEWLTKTFIQDTAAYFYDAEQRQAMQMRLRRLLIPEGGPYLVVAHSQGTIISYDVLRGLEDEGLEVPLLVTLGSPLGIKEVQDHVTRPLAIPKNVENWSNFADGLDPVALDKDLADDFTPKGRIEDELVANRDSFPFAADFDPHSSTGYLKTPDVRAAVSQRIPEPAEGPVASFVVARDVASDMDRSFQRLPVLIELSADPTGGTLAERRAALVKELTQLTGKAKEADIDPLARYVAASLTQEEIVRLAARHQHLNITRIWKNSRKRALLDQSGQTVQAYTAQLGYGATGRGVNWAVLDTGVQGDHPHFATFGNVKAQFDCTQVGDPVHGDPVDGNGHGTHVAGIIGGTGEAPNSRYKAMAPEAGLYAYKVLDDQGGGLDSWIIKALDHVASVNDAAAELVIHGVNLSLGGYFDATVYGCGHSPICRELRRLWRQGVVVCIAAGNEGRLVLETEQGAQELNLDLSIGDPANLEDAVAVGSVHKTQPHLYGISYFSSRGPTADGRRKPDLVAPGEKVFSCNARFSKKSPETHYLAMSGTSMACPHVSGLIAAFLSVRREFIGFPDRVKDILLQHCTDLGRDPYHQGAGMPNLVRMLAGT